MNGALELLLLLAAASLATFALDRWGRRGYGLISGAELFAVGIALGPVGLDLVPKELLAQARVPLALACCWLGFRFGLRLRPAALRAAGPTLVVGSQLEPLFAFGLLWFALSGVDRAFGLGLPWPLRLGLAGLGSATTKSALGWIQGRHRARGLVTTALAAVTGFDDLAGTIVIALLFALLRPATTRLPAGALAPALATLGLGAALAALALLLLGRGRLRQDLAWIALFGLCALGCGLATELGSSPVAVGALLGIGLGWLSPHGDAIVEITEPTERPLMMGLLLLGGAWIPATSGVLAVAFLFATLRILVKLASGALVAVLPLRGMPRRPTLGAGLLAGGGLPLALAFSCALALPDPAGPLFLAATGATVLTGDLIGAPALKWLLSRHGELPATEAR
ncbi:MAG: cation:proton antiporter [Deltaproteobacteria bacterium]